MSGGAACKRCVHANLSFLCASVRRVLIVMCPTAEASRAPSCVEESPRRRGQAAERSEPGRSLQASPPCELSTSVLSASPHCQSYRSQCDARVMRHAAHAARRTPCVAYYGQQPAGFVQQTNGALHCQHRLVRNPQPPEAESERSRRVQQNSRPAPGLRRAAGGGATSKSTRVGQTVRRQKRAYNFICTLMRELTFIACMLPFSGVLLDLLLLAATTPPVVFSFTFYTLEI